MCCFEQLFAMAPTYLRSPLTFGILPARCPFASVRGSLHLLSHLGTTVWALSWFGSPIQSLLGGPLETLRKAFCSRCQRKLLDYQSLFLDPHLLHAFQAHFLPSPKNKCCLKLTKRQQKKGNHFALTKSFPQLISRRSELGRR